MKKILRILSLSAFILASCKSENIKKPEYRDIRNARIMNVGLLETTAGLDFIYYNPNNFGVQLTNASGDVYIDDMFFGRFDIQDKVTVRKHQEFTVPAIIIMDNISVLKNHRGLLEKKEAKIRIEGFVTVAKAGFNKQLPIKYEGIQNIERLRAIVAN